MQCIVYERDGVPYSTPELENAELVLTEYVKRPELYPNARIMSCKDALVRLRQYISSVRKEQENGV